jgi:hypothetical protein
MSEDSLPKIQRILDGDQPMWESSSSMLFCKKRYRYLTFQSIMGCTIMLESDKDLS